MNINLFGRRCLVEYHKPKSNSCIVIPDAAQERDSHRMGFVRYIGDCKVKGKAEPVPSLVKVGDLVVFQINQIMQATQTYVLDGKHYMNILQDDLIARTTSDEVTFDTLEMLGDYVLLKFFMREQPQSVIQLPDSSSLKHSAPEFIYFKCQKKGSTVDIPLAIDQEVIVNFGRLTPMMFIKRSAITGTSENQEFCYTRKEWIDGVLEPDGVSGDLQPPA